METYVNANKLISALEDVCAGSGAGLTVKGEMLDIVRSFPAADVEEVKHGTWVKLDTAHEHTDVYKCSICDRRIWDDKGMSLSKIYERNPYCHCGAKMDGKENE